MNTLLSRIHSGRRTTSTGHFYRKVLLRSYLVGGQQTDESSGEFATNVIMAYGGGNWVHQIFEYGSGLNEAGISKFKAGQGMC